MCNRYLNIVNLKINYGPSHNFPVLQPTSSVFVKSFMPKYSGPVSSRPAYALLLDASIIPSSLCAGNFASLICLDCLKICATAFDQTWQTQVISAGT